MKFFSKLLITLMMVVGIVAAARADGDVTFEVRGPMMVAEGEAFRIEFSVNADPDKESFRAPSFEGFEVLAGPTTSTSRNFSIINGQRTSSYTVSYYYVLLGRSAGTFTVAPAEISVGGRKYRTQPMPVEVVDESSGGNQNGNQGGNQGGNQNGNRGSAGVGNGNGSSGGESDGRRKAEG